MRTDSHVSLQPCGERLVRLAAEGEVGAGSHTSLHHWASTVGLFRRIGGVARRRAATGLVGLACIGLLAGCGTVAVAAVPTDAPTAIPTPLPSPVAATAVSIQNFAFNPTAIVVPVGATVTWTNNDVEEHTATSLDATKVFDSDFLGNGKSYSFTFAKAGTYDYRCTLHPEMRGRVVVVAK